MTPTTVQELFASWRVEVAKSEISITITVVKQTKPTSMTPEDLPKKLRRLAHLVERGDVPTRVADRLSIEADRALRLQARDQTLRDLAAMMPGSSRWETAGRLTDWLRDFETRAWPRIRTGARPPRGEIEQLCAAILEHGEPPGQRIVWEVLKHRSTVLERPPRIERTFAMTTG